MKSTGMVRKIDELGRVVLPKELRQQLGIEKTDDRDVCVEIFVEGDSIVLKKYEPACLFCGEAKDNITLKGRRICRACLEKLNRAALEPEG